MLKENLRFVSNSLIYPVLNFCYALGGGGLLQNLPSPFAGHSKKKSENNQRWAVARYM